MNLLRLLGQRGAPALRTLLLLAALTAMASTAVLAVVNIAAANIAAEKKDFLDLRLMLAFGAAVVLFTIVQIRLVSRMAMEIETAVHALRMRLTDRVRDCDLLRLERFGQSRLFDSISQASQTITQNSQFLAVSLQSMLLTIAILVYIAVLSMTAFLLIGALLGLGGWIYVRMGSELDRRQRVLADDEARLFEAVSDLFDGFKEQRLNSARSTALGRHFVDVSFRAVETRSQVHKQSWHQFVFGETAFNLMLGIVVFVVPAYSAGVGEEMTGLAAAVLFMSAPVFGLMQSLAIMTAADGAAGRMMRLEGELASLAEEAEPMSVEPRAASFESLELREVSFRFPADEGDAPFGVGPLTLNIHKGEIVFITGGNGSGKSTLLKLLTGLYVPSRGTLLVDGRPIDRASSNVWRERVATVFADFHLFARLYGTPDVPPARARELLDWMALGDVTAFEEHRFTRRDLSSGQRKRLALVGALLENKPVLVLDEWAADQDPHFRRQFYREVLPALREKGLTIIAVTHDDHYFDVADRRLHMEEGYLREVDVTGPKGMGDRER